MISWMQKHNKYLIITIWIATIAFIGAGFVGWGSYQYGSKAGAIGKVGNIEITQERWDMSYQNLYTQYNEALKGNFDDAKAKEMGLPAKAFKNLSTQAQLLNLANEYGIIVSEKELGAYIASIKAFQDKGQFSKIIYQTYLKNRRMKAKSFEVVLRDELTVKKLMDLLGKKSTPYEVKVLASALSIADKIAYRVVNATDVNVTISDEELKNAWQESKSNYTTKKKYELSIYWTDVSEANVSEKDLMDFYDKNSFNYTDASGKQLDFNQTKDVVLQDLKIKKAKKQALRDYVAFKKGEKNSSETITLEFASPKLSKDTWDEIANSSIGDIIKPKIAGLRYATVKIVKMIDSRIKTFDEAKENVLQTVNIQKITMKIEEKSKNILKNINSEKLTSTDWLTMGKFDNLNPLNQQESLQFLQKLFTSSAKKGIITLSNNIVVYRVIEQKIEEVDSNLTNKLTKDIDNIKESIFEQNLFKTLDKTYPTEKFVKGI